MVMRVSGILGCSGSLLEKPTPHGGGLDGLLFTSPCHLSLEHLGFPGDNDNRMG
jgi:hypothetical protein